GATSTKTNHGSGSDFGELCVSIRRRARLATSYFTIKRRDPGLQWLQRAWPVAQGSWAHLPAFRRHKEWTPGTGRSKKAHARGPRYRQSHSHRADCSEVKCCRV